MVLIWCYECWVPIFGKCPIKDWISRKEKKGFCQQCQKSLKGEALGARNVHKRIVQLPDQVKSKSSYHTRVESQNLTVRFLGLFSMNFRGLLSCKPHRNFTINFHPLAHHYNHTFKNGNQIFQEMPCLHRISFLHTWVNWTRKKCECAQGTITEAVLTGHRCLYLLVSIGISGQGRPTRSTKTFPRTRLTSGGVEPEILGDVMFFYRSFTLRNMCIFSMLL